MYSRQFKEPPARIIQDGKANFGTYSGLPQNLAIKGMKAPYAGIPLPSIISKLRIKSRLNYIFSNDDFIGIAEFSDFRFFGLAEIIFWNKQTKKKYVYHTGIPTRWHFVPITTNHGVCSTYRKKRYLKIVWGRNHRHCAFTFRVKGDSVRPDAEGFFFGSMNDEMHSDAFFVNPSPGPSRCSTTWFTAMTVNGQVTINKEPSQKSTGFSIMSLSRSYIKLHSITTKAWGLGKIGDKNIAFQLGCGNLDAADSDKYNDNVLVVDGKQTALPPVVMTYPFGLHKKWIIQDTENMVDLTFTPESWCSRLLNIIFLRRSYTTLYGSFDGVLLDSKGEKINLKNFSGIISRSFLRNLI